MGACEIKLFNQLHDILWMTEVFVMLMTTNDDCVLELTYFPACANTKQLWFRWDPRLRGGQNNDNNEGMNELVTNILPMSFVEISLHFGSTLIKFDPEDHIYKIGVRPSNGLAPNKRKIISWTNKVTHVSDIRPHCVNENVWMSIINITGVCFPNSIHN